MGAAEHDCLLCCLLYVLTEGEGSEGGAGPFSSDMLAASLGEVAPGERVVLCGCEGIAIAFLGYPADSLHVAFALRDAACARDPGHTPRWRMGLDLGPVQLLPDREGQIGIAGDGLELAQLLASFAAPGGIVVSRAYYEVVVRLSAECARLLRDVPVAGVADRPAAQGRDSGRQRSWIAAPRQFSFAVALVAATLAGLIYAFWAGRDEGFFGKRESDVRTDAATRRPPPEIPPPQTAALTAPSPRPDVRIVLAVAPWGEVYVDGEKRGVTPPLKRFALPPGAHVIQIRNGNFPPYTARIDAVSGGEIRIKHRF